MSGIRRVGLHVLSSTRPAVGILAAVAGASLLTVPDTPTTARTPTGEYVSWKEHLVDDERLGGVPIRGSDGLQMADFDGDGILDIVSVHEDSNHVRLAFGSKDPDRWHLATLADGKEARAAEDAAVGDVNGDGHVDILVACELAHVIYFQNPGKAARTVKWPRAILENTRNRGSFIRVFLSDLDRDGKLEAIAANKGEQLPSDVPGQEKPLTGHGPLPVSWFEIPGNPLDPRGWKEHELIRLRIPINSLPVDIDGDGDMDVIAGSRGERRMVVLENQGSKPPRFASFPVKLEGLPPGMAPPWGFMIAPHDFSGDGRPDLLVSGLDSALMWLEQPTRLADAWKVRVIGSLRPDAATGIAAVDINSDGRADVITGGYSQEPRDHDGLSVGAESVVGRIAWFENPGSMDKPWTRHDVSRTKRGMYDTFVARDMDGDGDVDFVATRGNSGRLDGVFWLEQVRSKEPQKALRRARATDSEALPLPAAEARVR